MPRGKFIVIEGGDGTGKTTLAQSLLSQLPETIALSFPDRSTIIGQKIDQVLRGGMQLDPEELHLLFTANREEKQQWIDQTLNQGKNIICDRYSYSGIAYSMAQFGLTLEWCLQQEQELQSPDIVLFLDMNPEASYSRLQQNRSVLETTEKLPLQKKVYDSYQQLKNLLLVHWVDLDASKSPNQVLHDALSVIRE